MRKYVRKRGAEEWCDENFFAIVANFCSKSLKFANSKIQKLWRTKLQESRS